MLGLSFFRVAREPREERARFRSLEKLLMIPQDSVHIRVAGYHDLPGQDAVVDWIPFTELAIDRIRVVDELGRERPPRYPGSQSLLGQPRGDVDRLCRSR